MAFENNAYFPTILHDNLIYTASGELYLIVIGCLLLLSGFTIYVLLRNQKNHGSGQIENTFESLSHDIRTPLNSIVGYCQILMSDPEIKPRQLEYLSTISESSGILLSRINRMLEDSEEPRLPMPVSTGKVSVKKILIVDDVPINRTFLKIMLQRHGYELTEAVNGKEALEMINSTPPDLILMDIMMPVMDGFETVRILRSYNNHFSKIPVIAVTANNIKSSHTRLTEAGFNGYLQKPFKEDELLKIIAA